MWGGRGEESLLVEKDLPLVNCPKVQTKLYESNVIQIIGYIYVEMSLLIL